MDVTVLHNSTNINSYVIDYKREHRICSGIGTLLLTLSSTYTTTITTWDNFTIYENGSLVGIYYVNMVEDSQPEGTIRVNCQDETKRLSEYYIAENYLVDYYSLTGGWITKFLGEAGVSNYSIPGAGVSLSENTSLGMSTAYEQILTLLQMSGWYLRFEGSRCIIGDLETSAIHSTQTLANTDILDIKLIKHDKMLRNRALVLGTGSYSTGQQISADLHKHTPYNYDNRDLRAVVVSNSSIATQADAYRTASKLLNAFGKITVEKHIRVHDVRGISIGDYVRVENGIWSGTGLVTTVTVDMSSSGLTTTIILDERCPRLFTSFNMYTDYVYASTTTSGVFRKEIESGVWQPYSSGLLNPNIVDLYVNNGILSCIDVSGIAYRATDTSNYWTPITLSGFDYSYSRSGLADSTYSGFISARAIIQDKETNSIRIAADNRVTPVEWDYMEWTTSPMAILTPPGNIGWVVDVSPYDGSTKNVYPINPSGYVNICTLDIENDGRNDYVSVFDVGSGLVSVSGESNEPNFGKSDYALEDPFQKSMRGSKTVASDIYNVFKGTIVSSSIYRETIESSSVYYVEDNYGSRLFANIGYDVSYGNNTTMNVRTIVSGNIVLDSTCTFIKSEPSAYNYTIGFRKYGSIYKLHYYNAPAIGIYADHLRVYGVDINPTTGGTDVLIFDEPCAEVSSVTINDIAHFVCLSYSGYDIVVKVIRLNLLNNSYESDPVYTYTCPPGFVRNVDNLNGAHCSYVIRNESPVWYLVYTQWEPTPISQPELGEVHIVINGQDEIAYSEVVDGAYKPISFTSNIFEEYRCNQRDYFLYSQSLLQKGGGGTYVHSLVYSDDDIQTTGSASSTGLPVNKPVPVYSKTIFPTIVAGGTPKKFYKVTDFKTQANPQELILPGETLLNIFPNLDSADNTIYAIPRTTSAYIKGLSYNNLTLVRTFDDYIIGDSNYNTEFRNHGNFLHKGAGAQPTTLAYVNNLTGFTYVGPSFTLLRRDDDIFTPVHSGISADRIDISNQFPITAGGLGIYDTNFLAAFQGVVTDVSLPLPSGEYYNDHRYFDSSSGILSSGMLDKFFLYTTASGIMQRPLIDGTTLGEATVVFMPASGVVSQIETSTNRYEDQYIFVSTSGSFYQTHTTNSGIWNEYIEGLPSGVVITRIRLDDRF